MRVAFMHWHTFFMISMFRHPITVHVTMLSHTITFLFTIFSFHDDHIYIRSLPDEFLSSLEYLEDFILVGVYIQFYLHYVPSFLTNEKCLVHLIVYS